MIQKLKPLWTGDPVAVAGTPFELTPASIELTPVVVGAAGDPLLARVEIRRRIGGTSTYSGAAVDAEGAVRSPREALRGFGRFRDDDEVLRELSRVAQVSLDQRSVLEVMRR